MTGNAQSKQNVARTRELDRRIGRLHEVARLAVTRAAVLELHAAKNHAAGWKAAASDKLEHAAELRRIATFLADYRVHRFICENEAVRQLLMGEHGTRGRTNPPSTTGEAACR